MTWICCGNARRLRWLRALINRLVQAACEAQPKNFPVGVAGQIGDEHEFARSLVGSEAGAAMSIERRFGQIARRNHEGRDLLALRQFGESDNGDVLYSVAFRDDELDLGRVHIGAAADDEIRGAPQEMQEAVLVEGADIAWIGPASFEAVARTCRALSIDAPRHAGRAQADGAGFARAARTWSSSSTICRSHMRQHAAKRVGPRIEIGA